MAGAAPAPEVPSQTSITAIKVIARASQASCANEKKGTIESGSTNEQINMGKLRRERRNMIRKVVKICVAVVAVVVAVALNCNRLIRLTI